MEINVTRDRSKPSPSLGMGQLAVRCEQVNVHYGEQQALHDISMEIQPHCVTAFIGPSGCGKSTLLRCMNRMNDVIENFRIEGSIHMEGEDI